MEMSEETRIAPQEKKDVARAETAPANAKNTRPAAQKGDIATFHDSYGDAVEIHVNHPLPEYNSGPVKAYMARGRDRAANVFFALVCEKHLVPRIYAVTNYKNLTSPTLVPLESHGVTYWPPAKEERYVFLYKNVIGRRIHAIGQPEAMGWRQETVMDTIVKPLTAALYEFKDNSFVHGAICPSNMFADTSAGSVQHIILGDCLALPPSYTQPVLYETIERAMASPVGRGMGSVADDMYAFGVSLAVIMRSHDPLQGMTDDQIIREKVENGSYAAITGKDRFKGSILELLRGLLHDDPRERWTIEEMMTWLDGRRLSPKQALKHKRAARPLTYAGQKYLLSSILAMDIDLNPGETARIVEGGDLNQWLDRSLEDEEITERVETAMQGVRDRGMGPGYEERLASNLSIALDPYAPIRYKGLRLMGEGIGLAMAEAAILKQDLMRFVELFSHNIAMNWLLASKNTGLDSGSLISRFDACRNYIRHGKVGYGFERCIYTMCSETPCLSEKLRGYYVQTPEQMINAFEQLCLKDEGLAMILDRHSMAFLSVKEPKVIDSYLFDLGSNEEHRRVLGNLRTLGAIQKRFNLGNFPGLAKVFMAALPSVYARYHDREVREKLEANCRKYAADGDIGKMAVLLSNTEMTTKDFGAFKHAMMEYAELTKEYANLDKRMKDKNVFGKTTGKEIAAVASSIIAAIVMLSTAFVFFSNHSVFGF
jgi:eukaryotic-like serine/threonine-protein kinase